MPAVLVTGPTVTQNSLFSLAVAETITSTHYSTHYAYPRRNGQAELAWVAGYIHTEVVYPLEDGHPSRY